MPLQVENKVVKKRILNDPVTYPRLQERIRVQAFFSEINWRKLNAGILTPPFVPDPKTVYAKDIDDVGAFSTVKGVQLEDEDNDALPNDLRGESILEQSPKSSTCTLS
ncbi:hypothetical protein VZT92_000732 [Zoarces viviparus]|uniref:G protein-coupled receptor kinase n=1 Tax=Zoarces viviparus TaxID=48416 RepID=A0AAW1G8Q8_ZOAVI